MKRNIFLFLLIFAFITTAVVTKANDNVIKDKVSYLAKIIKNNISYAPAPSGRDAIVLEEFFSAGEKIIITPSPHGTNIEIEISDKLHFWVNVDGSCELENSQEEEIASFDPDYPNDVKSSYHQEKINSFLVKYYNEIVEHYRKAR